MTVQRWAMVRDGVTENVILWDGDTATWQPPDGVVMMLETDAPPQPTPAPQTAQPADGQAWQALADAQTLGDVRDAATQAGGA